MCERNCNGLPLICAPSRHCTHTPAVCPDGESNLRPLVYGMMLQPSEPHRPGHIGYLFEFRNLSTVRVPDRTGKNA